MILIIILLGILIITIIKVLADKQAQAIPHHSQVLKRFKGIIEVINEAAYAGQGIVVVKDHNNFNLYKDHENQIIQFYLLNGQLSITWKLKWHHHEVVHKRQIDKVYGLSYQEQEQLGKEIVTEMDQVIEGHKRQVENEIKIQFTHQTKESIKDSVETDGVAGLAMELEKIYYKMGIIRNISSKGNELIINDTDPEMISGFENIFNILNNRELFSDSEIAMATFTLQNMIDSERNEMRNQKPEDRELYKKAGVQKITHLYDGKFAYSIDYIF